MCVNAYGVAEYAYVCVIERKSGRDKERERKREREREHVCKCIWGG